MLKKYLLEMQILHLLVPTRRTNITVYHVANVDSGKPYDINKLLCINTKRVTQT